MVLSELGKFTIRPLYGERVVLGGAGRASEDGEIAAARGEIMANPSRFIAQPDDCDAMAVCFEEGKPVMRRQDHILFGVRRGGGDYHVIPGALTRISTAETPYTASELGGGSKDTWVEVTGDAPTPLADRSRVGDQLLPSQHVTSRVAEAFYWIGRYLERAQNLATMVSVIEALELEELNPTERTLYRPVWNRILPPLENPDAVSRRNISSAAGRCRLTLDLDQTDSVVRAILKAAANAESILECLSVEAWSVLDGLRAALRKIKFRPHGREGEMTIATRKACELAVNAVPQFFGTAERTMIADGGWAFCEIGQYLERAIITANAASSILRPMPGGDQRIGAEHATEIRLSAFLRLLNSRDVYRRVYQMRIEPGAMLELLWRNPVAPRSVTRCLALCRDRLTAEYASASAATDRTLGAIESLLDAIRQTPWESLPDVPPASKNDLSARLLDGILEIHHLIADGFLTHQVPMRPEMQTLLFGPKDAFRDRASH
jgi:uncharacterized alpha-E superfamily protein